MEHLKHGYSLREIVTHLVCSVTTVPPTCPRLRRRGTELVRAGRGWNEEDLTVFTHVLLDDRELDHARLVAPAAHE